MFFLQAFKAPVVTRYRNKLLFIPRINMDDIIEKGAELGAAKLEKITEDMAANAKREYLTLYPSGPLAFNDIKAWIRTTEGARWAVTRQLPLSRVFDFATRKELDPIDAEETEAIIKANGTGRIAALAWVIADLNEEDVFKPDPISEEEAADPLLYFARLERETSQKTGSNATQTSGQPTQEQTPGNAPSPSTKDSPAAQS